MKATETMRDKRSRDRIVEQYLQETRIPLVKVYIRLFTYHANR